VNQATLQAIRESIQPGQEWLFPGRSNGHLMRSLLRCWIAYVRVIQI
jgi:hypothetical protein